MAIDNQHLAHYSTSDVELEIEQAATRNDFTTLQRLVYGGDAESVFTTLCRCLNSPARSAAWEIDVVKGFLSSMDQMQTMLVRFFAATIAGEVEQLKTTIDAESDATIISHARITVLQLSATHVAALFNHADICKTLVNYNPNALAQKDDNGRTALHYAACLHAEGHNEILTALQSLVAASDQKSLDLRDNEDKSPLHYRQQPINIESIRRMIQHALDEKAAQKWPFNDEVLHKYSAASSRLMSNNLSTSPKNVSSAELSKRPIPYNPLSPIKIFGDDTKRLNDDDDNSSSKTPSPNFDVAGNINHQPQSEKTVQRATFSPILANKEEQQHHSNQGNQTTHAVSDVIWGNEYEELSRPLITDFSTDIVGHQVMDTVTQENILTLDKFRERIPTARQAEATHQVARLFDAVRAGNTVEVRRLLEERRDLALVGDAEGVTAIHRAVVHGESAVLRAFLTDYSYTRDVVDIHGRTPLHYAAVARDGGHLYKILLKADASQDVKDAYGMTPVEYVLLQRPHHQRRSSLNVDSNLLFNDEQKSHEPKTDSHSAKNRSFNLRSTPALIGHLDRHQKDTAAAAKLAARRASGVSNSTPVFDLGAPSDGEPELQSSFDAITQQITKDSVVLPTSRIAKADSDNNSTANDANKIEKTADEQQLKSIAGIDPMRTITDEGMRSNGSIIRKTDSNSQASLDIALEEERPPQMPGSIMMQKRIGTPRPITPFAAHPVYRSSSPLSGSRSSVSSPQESVEKYEQKASNENEGKNVVESGENEKNVLQQNFESGNFPLYIDTQSSAQQASARDESHESASLRSGKARTVNFRNSIVHRDDQKIAENRDIQTLLLAQQIKNSALPLKSKIATKFPPIAASRPPSDKHNNSANSSGSSNYRAQLKSSKNILPLASSNRNAVSSASTTKKLTTFPALKPVTYLAYQQTSKNSPQSAGYGQPRAPMFPQNISTSDIVTSAKQQQKMPYQQKKLISSNSEHKVNKHNANKKILKHFQDAEIYRQAPENLKKELILYGTKVLRARSASPFFAAAAAAAAAATRKSVTKPQQNHQPSTNNHNDINYRRQTSGATTVALNGRRSSFSLSPSASLHSQDLDDTNPTWKKKLGLAHDAADMLRQQVLLPTNLNKDAKKQVNLFDQLEKKWTLHGSVEDSVDLWVQAPTLLHLQAQQLQTTAEYRQNLTFENIPLLAVRNIHRQTARDVAYAAGNYTAIASIDDAVLACIMQRQHRNLVEILLVAGYPPAYVFDIVNENEVPVDDIVAEEAAQAGDRELHAWWSTLHAFVERRDELFEIIRTNGGNNLLLRTTKHLFERSAMTRTVHSVMGCSVLCYACAMGRLGLVEYLLSKHPHTIIQRDFRGRTAAHYATVSDNNEVLLHLMRLYTSDRFDCDVSQVKDFAGNAPSYYLARRSEILNDILLKE